MRTIFCRKVVEYQPFKPRAPGRSSGAVAVFVLFAAAWSGCVEPADGGAGSGGSGGSGYPCQGAYCDGSGGGGGGPAGAGGSGTGGAPQGGSGGSGGSYQGGTGGAPQGGAGGAPQGGAGGVSQGGSAGAPPAEPPPYDESPILFVDSDPAGTSFFTLADTQPRSISGNYFGLTALSPSRRRVLQDAPLEPVNEVHEVAPGGALVGRFPRPGRFVGWRGDDTLIFANDAQDGITGNIIQMNVDGTGAHVVPLPPGIESGFDMQPDTVLSPDGRAVALDISVYQPDIGYPQLILVLDVDTGAELARWPVPDDLRPGRPFWAADGRVVFHSFAAPFVMSARLGDAALSGRVEVPFQSCGHAERWVSPDVVLMVAQEGVGKDTHCSAQWLVATDGLSAHKWESVFINMASADGRKVLLMNEVGESFVADPDGANVVSLPTVPQYRKPTW